MLRLVPSNRQVPQALSHAKALLGLSGNLYREVMIDKATEFGQLLKAFRRRARLSQEELAERSRLSIRALGNLERGLTKWPHPDSICRIADALGLHDRARAEFMAATGRRLGAASSAYSPLPEERASRADGEPVTTSAQASASGGLVAASEGNRQLVFQLPAAPADFTGRVAESQRLAGVLTAGRARPGVPLAVVSGPPGVGKTSLSLLAAHTVRAQFGDGQLWVDLAGTSARPRDPAEVLGEFLRVLGVPGSQVPPDLDGRAACYRSCLAGQRVLVMADDAATAGQVRPLLPGTAGSAMVATSRSRLEGLDGAHLLLVDVMTAEEAVGLLGRITGEDRVAAERTAAVALAHACGGLPLALRISGAKLAARPAWPLSVMADRLSRAQDRLRELEWADVSVRASIASSYEALPERPRRAFRLLALLGPADFTEWTVAALLGEPQADDVVAELERRSLIIAVGVDATGEPLFRLHDLLRDFAAEQLVYGAAADHEAALRRTTEGWPPACLERECQAAA